MLPIITVAGLRLTTYTLLWGLGILTGAMVAFWRLAEREMSIRAVAALVAVAVIGGLAAQVAVAALLGLREAAVAGRPFVLKVSMNIFVFVLGVAMTVKLYWRHQPLQFWPVLDAAAVALVIGEAIGRLGCFGAGCCYGQTAAPSSWLALYLPDPTGLWAMRYPTQLFSSVGALSVVVAILCFEAWRRRQQKPAHWPFAGLVGLATLFLFGVQRMIVESYRADPALLGPLHLGHILAAAICLSTGTIIARRLFATGPGR